MEWFESIILGLVQGLTEFLPVSSSGHLMIARELLGIQLPEDSDFLSYEVIVHAATVCATIVVFRKQIWELLKGVFAFKYNDQTDFVLKICVSMIPVFVVGMFFKDYVESLFGGLGVVGVALIVTAVLLFLSDVLAGGRRAGMCRCCLCRRLYQRLYRRLCYRETGTVEGATYGVVGEATTADGGATDVATGAGADAADGASDEAGAACSARVSDIAAGAGEDAADGGAEQASLSERRGYRNGISYWQAFVIGVAQAVAVVPGLSRSGTTISTGLICGVKRSEMAYFSFLMVLVPILGECFLNLLDGGFVESSATIGTLPLVLGFLSAFVSGLFACKVMIALVKKASLKWFALYCAIVGVTITILNSLA